MASSWVLASMPCFPKARAIPSSSPSKWVALVPMYPFPNVFGYLSLSVLLGLEQKLPATLSFKPDLSVKAIVHPSSFSSLTLISHTTCKMSLVPRFLVYGVWICFLCRVKSHVMCLSLFSSMLARISSRQVL